MSSGGSSVQRSLSSLVSVVDVCAVYQQELAGQQRPLQTAQKKIRNDLPAGGPGP